MKAILKPFFALCGLVALSTALSADSRLFPVGGGGAGWGEPGFLYSDYLQTAAASGREVEFQGSFVLDNRRPFLAELGTAFPGRVVDEVKSLPLREWGLGYVFEKRRPAHQRALLERGWRLADWLAEETLMAATESSRGGGLIRTLEFDLQSELGGRRAQVGLNVLGALRESNDEAIAWQFRGFKSSGGLGGNTGLIWRRAVANDRALAGANVFLDYETYADENFWRGSAGAELRSAWADVFGNVYRGFSDDVKKNNRTTYTADGYDVELNVHSPELPWLVGEVAYYNFEGKAGDKDDDGVRFGLRFNPLTDLELGVEYDNGDSDDDGKKKWAARIRYSGEFGGVLKAQYRPSTNSGNFEPRDWFFAPVEREYSQRIRRAGTASNIPEFTFSADATKLLAILPIKLEGAGLDLTVDDSSGTVAAMGMIDGVQISPRPLRREAGATAGEYTYFFPIGAALRGTVTVTHKTGNELTFQFPRSGANVVIGSTVEISTEEFDYLALLDGTADILLGSGGGMFVAEQRLTTTNDYRRFTVFANAAPNTTLTLGLVVDEDGTNTTLQLPLPLPDKRPVSVRVEQVIGNTTTNINLERLRASVELANDPFLTDTSPPSYYKNAGAASNIVILGTLRTGGGGGEPYTSSKVSGSGDLVINNGVVGISTLQAPAKDGNTLVLQIMVNDNSSDVIGAETPALVVSFTVVYQEIVPLAASLPGFSGIPSVYGVLGDSARKVVATAAVVGSGGAITYSPIDGALRLEAGHVLYIPAGNPPAAGPDGNLLTLNSEVRQATNAGVPAMTVTLGLTLRYIGIPAVGANLNAVAPAISTGLNSFAITAEAGDTGKMDVFSVAGSGGAGGTFTYRKITGELDFAHDGNQRVSIPSGMAPRTQPYSVVIEIQDSGTGATETPHYTLTVQVRYFSVNEVNLSFDDRDENPTDGLATVFGLQGNNEAQNNVARVVAGGGFGGVTLAKVGDAGLDLEGNASGARINIPANNPPQPTPGRMLLITVSANDSAERDPNTNGITDPKTATMTLHYVQVNQLGGAYYPVNSNGNGQVPSGASQITAPVHTVGMAAATTQFTVASLSVSGGVGNYNYREIGGGRELSVDNNGQILMAQGIVPNPPDTGSPYEIVVEVNDDASHANGGLTPAVRFTLTVSYNTIVPLAARVLDTRDDATPLEIANGGRVYFLKSGANANATFGRLVVSGGFPSPADNYTITPSSQSGIAYDTNTGNLSMTKCTAGAKSIRFTINDVGDESATDLTDELVVNFAVTSGADECLDAIALQLKDAANADATSPLNIYGLEGKTDATVVASWTATGGGAGDFVWTQSGDLGLVPTSDGKVRQVQVPQGTTPQTGSGRELVMTVTADDGTDSGGFLIDPQTAEMTVNYIEVPSVKLALNRGGNAINSLVDIYGVESVAKTGAELKVADIVASGGSGNVAVNLQTSGTGATTADSFEIVSNNALNITKAFPAFGDGAENAVAAVVASDDGANSAATPNVTMRATVRLLPVLGRVEEGGDIVVERLNNVIQPSATSKTETEFTVYALASAKEERVIARINPASVARNAAVDGLSGLRLVPFDSTTTGSGTGLEFGLEGQVAAVKIADSATPTSSGADLNLVLTYVDEANAGTAAADVAVFTQPRMKTLRVKYVAVAAFEPKVRNAAGSEDLGNKEATVYVAPSNTDPRTAAKIMKVGGAGAANADMRIVSNTSTPTGLQVMPNGDVVVDGSVAKDTTLTVVVVLDDTAEGDAAGSVTDHATLTVTVAYLESRDVVANLVPLPSGNNHFLGDAATDGTRTVYWKASETRTKLPLFRLNAASGSGQYTYDSTGQGFNLQGFELSGSGNNDRMLELLASIGDGVKAFATVEIDDTGNADEIALTDPATLMATVEVKLVTAIDTALLVPANVPGGAPAGTTLGGLYVRSAAAAESSSVYIASVVARGGVEQFTYTRQSESSAELLLNADGEVHLAANYVPDGNKTLSIIIAANDGDSVDGSTLTEAAMITLEFVLAETIGAVAFLRNNGGAYVPNGTSANDVAWGSGMRTVKVKTADYGNEQLVVGVRGSGGLGNSPAYSIARATGGNENGLVTRTPSPDGYGLGVAVKDGAVASSAPQTFGITAVVNESGTDPNNLTPGATISVTVVYDKVDDIAAAFEDTDGDPIPGRHVVARSEGVSNTDLMVASLNVSGGVGKDTGGDYTFTQDTPGDLIVNSDGEVLVKGGVAPAIGLNLSATVKINDTGNWAHVSDELEVEITVLYSSKVVLDATIVDTRDDAVPANIPRTGGSVYFLNDDPDENAVFARVDFSGALPGDDTYVVTASDEVGLSYDTSTRELSMTKCTDTPSATKSIKLTANDSPDTAGVSDPLVVEIEVTSGAAQCFDAISARPERLNAVRGAHITDIPKFYRLAGDDLDADLPVATVHVDGGAPAYVSDKTGGVLNLVKGSQGELTVVIPSGRAPEASPNNLEIVLTVNDDSTKGGFLTDVAEVKMTVDFAEVQPHGNLQGVLADGVTGSLEDGLLTVRRVAASSTPLRIVTNIRPAIPTEERIATEGSFTNFQIVFNTTTNQQDLQLIANQVPDGEVRMITVKVENHKNLASADDEAQFAARPDRLFTIAVRYLGELEAAAYDSETETAIAGDVNRYVESDEGAVAVATVSVSGGTSPYSYNLVAGGLELGTDLTNMTVLIPASAVPSAAPGLELTVRIEVDDTGRADTTPLNVDLTANYILIPGHSDLQLVRDGRTQAEDLDGDTVYPKIVSAKSSGVVEALSGLAFKTDLSGETLKRESSGSAAELLFADDASVVEIAGDTEPDGSTLALVLRASDGESPAQAKARSDRLYTLQVRYMKELTADARTAASGGDVINAVREIRVTEAEADDAHFVAHISVDGGAGGNVIAVGGTDFEIEGNELRIAADVVPGDLASGKLLTATVKVNDDAAAVGGGETGEVEILVTANYITLPPVVGSFVETRGDGTKNVPTSAPVTVFSFYTFPPQNLAPATVVATAKATVTGRDGDTFTYHRVGGADTFSVDENTGAIEIKSRRPNNGDVDQHLVTVEFRAAANAVATRQTLTVRHQMIRSIASGVNALSTPFSCYRNVLPQPNPPNRGNGTGTQITVILPPGEEGTQYSPGGCSYFVNLPNRFVGIDPAPPGGNRIARTGQDASGLEVYSAGSDTRVRLVGTPPTFTAEDITLSVVVANTHTGPGGHVVPALLQTVYVVFPGVEKLEAVLEDSSGADAAITKPLTVYVGDTDASAKVVASVKASGGEGTEYSYTGTRTGGDDTALLLVTTADSNEIANRIAVPAGFVAKVSPGTEFRFEVAVNDTGGNAARRGATPERKVILTLQYIKTSGPLQAEAAYTTPDIADATNTTYYGAKGEALGAAVNVANIAPSGGIPNYSFAIEEDSSNPAANSELEISGSGNTRVVRLKSGATPSAATSEARRRVITVRVTDTGDVGNSIPVETVDVVVSVNFVEVETHGDLTVEDAGGNNLGTDFVVVTSGVSAQDVVLAPAASVYPERPTRRQDLGREAGVVSEVSHHGLRFNSNGLVITANTPLEGQTLSVVVQATDGATSQPTAAAQAAARQDQTYTISVRYVPAVAAEVLSTTDAALSNTDVVELTVVAGTQLVGKVSASGGVGGTYSYTPTPAQAGGTNLAVDADGNINIIAGTNPVAGDGLSITVNIAVDDDSANTEGDRDETSAANVQIRVKYVLLEDLALTAKDLDDSDVGAEASIGTFYLREGATTNSAVLVGSVEASGGIPGQGYTYARKGTGGDLTFNTETRQLHIPANKAAADPNTAAATLLITLEVTDSQETPVTKELTVRAVFVKVSPHGDLTINPQTGITQNTRNEYVVVRPASHTNAVDVANITAPQGDTVSKTGGDSELEFTAPNLRIANNTSPTRQTITAILTQTDGGVANDLRDEEGARPDRTHEIAVRYIPALAAEARDAAGNTALNAPIVITSKAGLRQVARIVASGGTSDSYSYAIENLHTGGNELIVGSSDGIVSIPLSVTPIVGGLALTVRITANDSGDDNDKTDPASALVTVMYHLLESPEIVAQDKDGTAALTAPGGANGAVFYQLSGTPLAADLPVAKVVGSKGTSPYEFAIEGSNTTGLEVDANTGNIILKSGQSTAATGAAADKVITVRLTDSQDTSETADATLTIRFEAVAPLPVVYLENPNDGFKVYDPTDKTLTVLVNAGVTGKQLVFAEVSGGAPGVNAAFVQGNLEHDAGNLEINIPAGTVPSGQLLSAVMRSTDGDGETTDTPAVRAQKTARPDRDDTILVRYMSHVGLTFTQNDGTTPLDVNTRINLQKIAGTPNLASIFVAKFEGRGGVGALTYSVSGNTESGKNVQYDTTNRVLWIDNNVNPTSGGLEITVVVSANDNEAATNGVTQNIAITYREAPATPLSGDFVAAAPSSDSRIVGAFNDDERVTVFGLNADGTTDGLPVIALSHNNPNVGAGQISKLSGNLDYANGQVSIPSADRKKFGDVFAGVFEANDGSPATQNATYSITVLLSERLQGTARGEALYVDAGRADDHATPNRGQYFYTADTESAVFRPVFTLPGITVEGLEVRSAGNNYEWDFATKQLRRNGAARANHAVAAAVTVLDPNANPKILPVPLALDLRNREVPALEIVNQDDSAADTTASQIAHTATPSTPIWTFRVKGGALTRTTYRPFHNLQVSGSGAFVVATLARVPGSGINEFADFEIRIDFTHTDAAQRRGQTLTLTVTAEDVGYPGLGAVEHVAEVILEQAPIPHVEAVLWTPEAAGTATQISAPVEIAVLAAGLQNVASVSVSKGLPANNQVYTYTERRIDQNGNELTGQPSLLFDESTGIISIPANLQPLGGDGLTITFEVAVDDTSQPTTDPATVKLELVYKLVPPLSGEVQVSDTGAALTSPTVIYQLGNNPTPQVAGLPVGVKVAASGGTPPYRYTINPSGGNPGKLGIEQTSGEVNILGGERPNTGAASQRTLTVNIADSGGQTSEAIVTVHFVRVDPIGLAGNGAFNFNSQQQCHEGSRRFGNANAELRMPVREEGFKFTNQAAPGESGICTFLGHFDDTRTGFGMTGGSGNLLRTTKETVGNLQAVFRTTETRIDVTFAGHTYTDGETQAKLVIAYNDDGPAKDLTPEFLKTLVVIFPGIARVDAVLNDEGGSPINLTGIEKRGPGGEKVIIGTIVASGGTGSGYTYTKAATGGGALALDSNTGEVSIPDDVNPAAGAGAALHLLVDVDDGGTNSDRTTAKQLRIEVQYIEEQGAPPLAGEVQNADGNEVTAAPTVYRVTNVPTPDLGLPTGLKVVGSGGTAPYSYAAKTPQPPNNKRLLVSADGQVISIPSGQTATPSGGDTERLMTVVITDGAGDTVEVAVTVNFETVSGHGALTHDLATDAAAGTGTNANTYYIARDGAQSGAVNVLSNVKSSEATNIEVVGIDSGLTFNYDSTANAGVVQIDASTVPSGQTFAATVRATDGDSTPQAAGRLDRTFQFSVVYLEHLEAQLWDAPSGGATIDIATAIEKTSAADVSVFVGSVSVSGGTGAYTFDKGTCTNLDVDTDGNVFIPADATDPVAGSGTPGSCQVIINDSGDGSAATPAHGAFNVQVNHILQETGPALPLLAGDLFFYRERGAGFNRRICPNNISCLTGSTLPPEIIPTDTRLTMWGMNSDTGSQFAFNVGFSVPAVVTAENGSDFEVTGPTNSPTGTRYRVALKAANIKRWGQELEARLVATGNGGTHEQLVTVKVLLAERMPTSALGIGPVGIDGGNPARPMQLLYPSNFALGDRLPGYQAVGDFPGVTVTGLEVFAVLASTRGPTNPVPIDTRGNFRWDEDAKLLRREGRPAQGGDPDYYVWLRGSGANPKIVPAVLTFRLRNRTMNPMTWQTNPGTITPTGNTSFEVKGGAQSRNYSPFADMVATVDSERFVISNMSRTDGNNDRRFSFDVSVAPGTPSGTHTATITVTDRGYTSSGTLTQEITVEVP